MEICDLILMYVRETCIKLQYVCNTFPCSGKWIPLLSYSVKQLGSSVCLKFYLSYGIAALLDVVWKLHFCLENLGPVEYCCLYWGEVCMPPCTVHLYCVLCTLLVHNVYYIWNSGCLFYFKVQRCRRGGTYHETGLEYRHQHHYLQYLHLVQM